MPRDCPTCLLEFTEPSEARTAFRSLAYINFNGNPLYLEWAPEDAFSKPADKSQMIRVDAPQVCVVFATWPTKFFFYFEFWQISKATWSDFFSIKKATTLCSEFAS